MNKQKFESLCANVLIRQMGRLLHKKLVPIEERLDSIAQEVVRLREDLEAQTPFPGAIEGDDLDD